MTETQLRNQVVSIMQGWIGCKESDGSHKKILDVYNSYRPLPRGWKMLTTNPWCAATVSAAFIKAGLTDIAPVECSCSQMISLYKKIGRWIEADNYANVKPGDLLMYDWDDDGRGDCTGAPEHVGMVTEVNGNTITVIEGNKNDAVGYRPVPVNGRYIRGYCAPDYASKSTKPTAKPAAKPKIAGARSWDKTAKNGVVFEVTASALNVRSSASSASKNNIMKTISKGSIVVWYGYFTGNFYLVKLPDGGTGYVHKAYLK